MTIIATGHHRKLQTVVEQRKSSFTISFCFKNRLTIDKYH